MDSLECPYCEDDVRPLEDISPGVLHEIECSECGKNFFYSIEYIPQFTASQAPCLNGADHDFQPIAGVPEEYFRNKRRCSFCELQVEVEE